MLRATLTVNQDGPSATADWQLFNEGPAGRTLHGLSGTAVDARNDGDGRDILYLVAAPGLARAPGSGRPRLGLTLIVERAPTFEDSGLEPLVTGGVLSIDLTVAPTAAELAQVAADTGQDVRALFVRRASWLLSDMNS